MRYRSAVSLAKFLRFLVFPYLVPPLHEDSGGSEAIRDVRRTQERISAIELLEFPCTDSTELSELIDSDRRATPDTIPWKK